MFTQVERSSRYEIRSRKSIKNAVDFGIKLDYIPESNVYSKFKQSPVRNISREASPYVNTENNRSPNRKENLYPDIDDEISDFEDELGNVTPLKNLRKTPVPEKPVASSSSTSYILVIAFLVILCAITLYSFRPSPSENSPSRFNQNVINCSQFIELDEKFPYQDKKLFKSLKIGIEGTVNKQPAQPSVFAFFSTDQNTLNVFMDEIVKITKLCIQQSNDPINLTNGDLNTQRFFDDHSKLIQDYKEELNKRSIMIVNNVDRLSTKVIPSLHSFTDTYNPLVRKSIIYFTLKVPEKPNGKPVDYIINYLQKEWKELETNIRDPLITRIVDQTFFLTPK